MKKWVRSTLAVTVGLGLFASNLSPSLSVSAQSSKDLQNVSVTNVNQPQIQKKLEQLNEKMLSEDTLIIKYAKPLTQAEHKRAGGSLITNFSDLNYAVVKVKNKKDFQKVMNNYKGLKHVNSVNPSALYKPSSTSDPKVKEQYFIDLLKLNEAHKLAGKNTVTVAVIDQGIDGNHPELQGKLLPSYNAVNPMNQGTPDFHGTHVAGIIAGNKSNGVGGFGVNPNVKILPIDVFDQSWGALDYTIAQGILHAIKNNAKVINMSLSGPMRSPLIEDAVKKALEKNITIVAAAGNSGVSMAEYPAAYEGVISVGSVDKNKKLAVDSTFGPSVDIVAPGVDVYSTFYQYGQKSTFLEMSGTSMASPMVAGVASLLLSKHPNLTPSQVEYILEHTADDLGDTGYDIKYGNGLVNPVAALKFDVKKLPALTSKPWTDDEIAEKAQGIDVAKTPTIKGAITKPFEEKWYYIDVKRGEYVQFALEGSAQFDYKLMLNLQHANGKDKLEINKVLDGKSEGKLYKAPYTGKLAFGVKDVNGNYDDSKKQLSKYTLSVKKYLELPLDESTFEKPIKIELPYKSKEEFRLIGEDGDNDYFSLSVEEEQVIKVDLSGIPGVDTSLSVYEKFDMPTFEDSELGKDIEFEIPSLNEEDMAPVFFVNNKGKSEGETLTFTAQPEVEYLIKVSNKDSNYFGVFDFLFNRGLMEEEQKPESSAISYQLNVEGKVLPPDEDTLPVILPTEEVSSLDKKAELLQQETGEEEFDYVQTVKDGALSYKIGDSATGYLQTLEDEDWFSVKPTEMGVYQFNLSKNDATVPIFSIYQVKVEKDFEGKEHTYFAPITSNEYSFWQYGELQDIVYAGLKKGETYYIKINTNYYNGNISFDPYKFTSKLLVKNPQDKYVSYNELEKIKNLPNSVIEGNFSMPNEPKVFYVESKTNDLYGITLEKKQVSDKFKTQYPKEILGDFFGEIVIVEDKNKNRKFDDDEMRNIHSISRGAQLGKTFGSYKMEKNKNYIIMVSASFDWPNTFSLMPFTLSIKPVNKVDEDKDSVVKNNIPSKPLALKTKSANHLQAVGHLNAGVPYGDEDWYVLKLDKNTKGKIELQAGIEIDGVISLYKDGKLISTADYYSNGDNEVLNFNLMKGTYHIKVRDINGNSTLEPYTLNVYK